MTIRCAKEEYFSSKLNKSCSVKKLWSNLRNLSVIGRETNVCTLTPDELNVYFGSTTASNLECEVATWMTCSIENQFQFCCVSEDEIVKNILSITSNAVGYDQVPIKFLKLILPFVLPSITHVINHCLTTSVFPDMWKIATVRPVPKKTNPQNTSDYRPISILPALSKTCERIMANQIMLYISSKNLLSPLQSGFRPKHSCTTAMLKILDDIRVYFDCNHLTLLCLLDFSKAFDSINHILLCNKLNYFFHFSSSATKLISSYLHGRYQNVMVNDCHSSFINIAAGVPQGSSLGPLLFSLFINDLLSLDLNSTIHAFADDVQLYFSGPLDALDGLVLKLNSDLSKILHWANNNGLRLNSGKCKVLPICYKPISFSSITPILLGNEMLEIVQKVKNLGFIINSRLGSHDHINYTVCKVYNVLRMLRYSSNFVSVEIKRYLVHQLIMPHFLYFCIVFSKLDSLSTRKINACFNHVTRYVFGLKRYDHISQYKTSILGVTIMHYLKIRTLIYIHSLLHGIGPNYLVEKLLLGISSRTRQCVLPKYVHINSSHLFFINAVRLWNSLPMNLRHLSSKSAFTVALYSHYKSMLHLS